MDIVVMLRTVPRNGGECHPGDIVEWRQPTERFTLAERTAFYLFLVTDVPDAHAATIGQKIMEGRYDDVVNMKRLLGLSNGSVTQQGVINYLSNAFPPAASNLATYFNDTTPQNGGSVLSVSWPNLKSKFRNKLAGRNVTDAEIGDVDA